MDIIDIILGSALTPQGEIESFAARAEKAVRDATTALNNIESITQQTNNNNAMAHDTLNTVNAALNSLDTNITNAVDDEIKKLAINLTTVTNQDNSFGKRLTLTYPDNTTQVINNVAKYYTTLGNNTDGTMTQRAIQQAINNINIPSTNLGPQNANKIVIVGPDGTIIPSATVTEETIINGTHGGSGDDPGNTPIPTPGPATGILGLKINYDTAIFTPTDDAINATTADFNKFKMYGGRTKCLVSDNGAIYAFYGDNNYTDTPENGYQVMIYQPKFYYKRTPLSTASTTYGEVIREELLQLSDVARSGYTLHPLFYDENNRELEYVLLSAYEGSIECENEENYKDIKYSEFLTSKLSSVSNAKPISGINNSLNIVNAEKLASNRGIGWHITTSKVISAQQMLAIVEFSVLNIQNILDKGICDLQEGGNNTIYSATTGATQILGNQSGRASSTTFTYNGVSTIQTDSGKVSVSYRGYENLWGNMWDYVGDWIVQNNSSSTHNLYICNNYNYSSSVNENYTSTNIKLPPASGWISGFIYNTDYDWLFIPIEYKSNANSLVPVGDYYLGALDSNGTNICIFGGPWFGTERNGLFYYAFNRTALTTGEKHTGTRLLHIPQSTSSIYINNIVKWNTKMGG